MSREIKFRVWATSNEFPQGKMYYPEDDNPPFLLNMMGDLIHAKYLGDRTYKTIWARIGYNWKLMQFTGLQMKDKEVYEGDVLDASYINLLTEQKVIKHYLVTFKNGTFMANLIGKSPYGDTPLYFLNERKAEVIGNIHDNPELLVAQP